MDLAQRLERILKAFDDFDLNDQYMKRLAVKPLYDFYQIALLEVGVTQCHLLRDTLSKYGLATRWKAVRPYLELTDIKPSAWDETIACLDNMRGSNEHKDYHEPKKQALLTVRAKALEFLNWVLAAGNKYLRQSKGSSTIDRYKWLAHSYSMQTAHIKHQYGPDTPLLVREYLSPKGHEGNPYLDLVPMREAIQERLSALGSVHDLTVEDLDRLITLVREVERIDAREDVYVRFDMCPKCGGKIIETREVYGSTCSTDPTPYTIQYRIGCDTCDFELIHDTVDV